MSGFTPKNLGVIRGVENDYEVHWREQDLAWLTLDGDLELEFCSVLAGGFQDEEDVLAQGADIVSDWDWDE